MPFCLARYVDLKGRAAERISINFNARSLVEYQAKVKKKSEAFF
jgi:hypothetical protein